MTLTFNDIEFFNAGIVTTDTEGTGPITLGAAVSGYNPSGIPDTSEGWSTYLWIRKDAEYEILRCTIASSVATVVEVVESTNGGAKVDWGAGEKTVVAMTAAEVFELIKTALLGKAGLGEDVDFNAVEIGTAIDTVDTEYTVVDVKDTHDSIVARVTVDYNDLGDGTQNGVMRLYVMIAGVLTPVLELDGE